MSRLGNRNDNAKAEAFFSTFKGLRRPSQFQVFASKAVARRELFEYIETYYNNKRLHSALGYEAPGEFEAEHFKEGSNFLEENVMETSSQKRNEVQESKWNKCTGYPAVIHGFNGKHPKTCSVSLWNNCRGSHNFPLNFSFKFGESGSRPQIAQPTCYEWNKMTSSEGLPPNRSSRSVTLLVKRILKTNSSYSNEQTVQLSMTRCQRAFCGSSRKSHSNDYGYSFSISLTRQLLASTGQTRNMTSSSALSRVILSVKD